MDNSALITQYLDQAKKLEAQEEWDKALEFYQQAVEIRSRNPWIHHSIGNILVIKERIPEAISSYRKATELKPDTPTFGVKLGDLLRQNRELTEAITCYQRAIEIEPDSVNIYRRMADVYSDLDSLENAEYYYEKVVSIAPESARDHLRLAQVLERLKKVEDAKEHLRAVINLSPSSKAAYYRLGALLVQTNAVNEAIQSFQQVLEMDPDCQPALRQLQKLTESHSSELKVVGGNTVDVFEDDKAPGPNTQIQQVSRSLNLDDAKVKYGNSSGKSGDMPFKLYKRRGTKNTTVDQTGFRNNFRFSPDAVGNYDEPFKRSSTRLAILSVLLIFYGAIALILFIKGMYLLGNIMLAIALSIFLLFWGFRKLVK